MAGGDVVAQAGSFVVNKAMAGGAALVVIVGLLVLAHWLVVRSVDGEGTPTRRRGVKALVIGSDGRASTSKMQVVMWTFAVFFAFVFLLLWGRSTNCDDEELRGGPRCTQAAEARDAFRDAIEGPLQTEYYVLLGFPLAAAIAAKAITTNKVANQAMVKPAADEAEGGVAKGLAEVVSNDSGQTDLMDFQYFAFNLLALAFFAFEFLTRPEGGLPDLPPTLIALAGLSTATYTTKKALEGDSGPIVRSVIPRRVPRTAGAQVTVVGMRFGAGPDDGGASGVPGVQLEGVVLAVDRWEESRILATISPAALAALPADPPQTEVELVVTDADGITSDPVPVELYAAATRRGGPK